MRDGISMGIISFFVLLLCLGVLLLEKKYPFVFYFFIVAIFVAGLALIVVSQR